MFYKGQLDVVLFPKVKALDPSFGFEDLRYIRDEILTNEVLHSAECGGTGIGVSQAEKAKMLADFALVKAELAAEQLSWRSYQVKMASLKDEKHEVTRSRTEAEQNCLNQCLAAHIDSTYRLGVIVDYSDASPFFSAGLAAFAAQPPARSVQTIARLNIVNAASLGSQASLLLNQLAPLIASDHAAFAENTATVIILPNVAQWGSARESSDAGVAEARESWKSKFQEAPRGLDVVGVFGMWDANLLSLSERELPILMLGLTSTMKDDTGVLSLFKKKSALFKKCGIPGLLQPLPRCDFKDWTSFGCQAKLDNMMEKRQHISGSSFYEALLKQAVAGLPSTAVHVRDWTTADPHLATGVANLNAQQDSKLPAFGYTGVTWQNFIRPGAGQNVKANCEDAIHDFLEAAVKLGSYRLPGFSASKPTDQRDSAAVAPAPPSNLKHTVPTGEHLLIKQSLHDIWDGIQDAEVRLSWASLVKTHNDKFNPSGVPHKARRPAPDNVAEGDAAEVLKPMPDQYAGVEELKAAGSCTEIAFGKEYKIYLGSSGQIYIQVLQDMLFLPTTPLFVLKGKVKTGEAASSAKETSECWVSAEFMPDTLTILESKPDSLIKVAGVHRMENLLQELAKQKLVMPRILGHTITRVGDTDNYEVKADEALVFDVGVNDEKMKATPVNIGAFTDMVALKKSPVIGIVVRLSTTNSSRMNTNHPIVAFRKTTRATAGQFVQLSRR